MYENEDELLREIAAGEDTFLEFKEVVFKGDQPRFSSEDGRATKVIAEVFVSLANTEGGVVLFGVNKYGETVGIDPEKRDLLEQWVVNCALDLCEPKGSIEPRINWRQLADVNGTPKLIMQVEIPKSRFYVHHTTDGKFLKRVSSHRTPIPAEQLGRLLAARSLLIPFEERPCPRTSLKEFSADRFNSYYERRFGSPVAETGVPLERLLENLKLGIQLDGGDWNLTNLGVLLFTGNPQQWLSGAYIEVAIYRHSEADGNTDNVKRFEGPIDDQVYDAFRFLNQYLPVSSQKTPEGRKDVHRYSRLALQEAVVNAVVHRDYELTGSQIIINVFPDRIEIRNPGFLHNTLNPEDLYAGCQPMRRNQHLAGFLRDFPSPITGKSLMEARGIGFLSLVRESEAISGRRPAFEVIGQGVKLTIFGAQGEDV
jgi:predicted HTH transcriptional regulator